MYESKSKDELIVICKERNIKGYSGKKKDEIINLILEADVSPNKKKLIDKVREQGLDKFYTNPDIVDRCLKSLNGVKTNFWNNWDLIVEPSAGNGSFLLKIPSTKVIGLDIEPEHKNIIEQDFFEYYPNVEGKILVLGNPPFGRVSSLAINFFNHASKWADMIAFIIPRTFRRISVQNRLNKNFHLIYDEEIPQGSFTPSMSVKCCFQVWERKEIERENIELELTHKDWEFLSFGPKDENNQPTPPVGADFAIRAYGGKCGEIVQTNLDTLRPKSWHWIKSNVDKELLIKKFKSLDYSISLDTARQNSIGRRELVSLYSSNETS